jgi:ADP-ribosyl-[dinitrogen reductase] hydrolase
MGEVDSTGRDRGEGDPGPLDRAAVPHLVLSSPAAQAPTDLHDRIVGVVVGAAVGDALGAPFEFDPRGTFSARLPDRRPDGQGDMIGGGAFGWEPGEFTDDTQMGLALASSLLTCGRYDPDDLWQRWQMWAETSSDVGNTTRFALGHPSWREVVHEHPEWTAANGALMRAFPLALATLGEDADLARDVTLHQSLLTHADPSAAWGAWLGVAMMRAGVIGEDPLVELERQLVILAERDGRSAERFLEMLAPGWTPEDGDRDGIGNGSVWGCLAQAVWALRRHATYADVVAAVVELGKDTDTVACVAGAIAGARDGATAIPAGWSGPVHGVVDTPGGQERYDLAGLTAVATALWSASAAGRAAASSASNRPR